MRYIFILFINIFLFLSCDTRYWEIQKSYNEFKSYIPDSLLFNFPEKLSEDYVPIDMAFPEVLKHNLNYCGIFIKHNTNKKNFNDEYLRLSRINGLYKICNDSCLIRIKVKGEQTNYNGNILNNCKYGISIVPDFHEPFSPVKEYNLSNNAEIFILGGEQGKYLSNEYLSTDRSLPREFKNGYSKGIIIDKTKKIIIYWLIVW